ncbi:MAG TPA: type II secretion system protein GspM [Anaerolineales bacterium]
MSDDDLGLKKKEMFGGDRESPLVAWGRKTLLGLLAIALAVLLLWFLLISPQANQISQLETQLVASQDHVATLEAQVADLESVKPQREVLSLLVDANTARYELNRLHAEEAAAALLNTSRTIALLSSELGDDYANTIASLEERLALAKADLDADRRFAALSDLEVFVNILLQLQRSLLTP